MKLTRAQKELLADVSNGDDRCTPSYPPAARLVDLGLCVWASEYRLAMTDAGRAARATIDHDVALGLTPPLHAEIRALLDRIASLEAALATIKTMVCGDRFPKWGDHDAVTASRMTIADLADAALSSSKQKDGE